MASATKVAIVTGANRGLGLEFVSQLRAHGYRVIAACRNPEDATALKALQADRAAGAIDLCRMDVADEESVRSAFEHVRSLTSSVDLVVNNAGIFPSFDPCLKCTTSEMASVFATNTIGPMVVTQQAAPLLNPEGSVVLNVSSELGSITGTSASHSCAYRVSKAALNMLTRNLSLELAPRKCIVFAMHPGWCATDMGSQGGSSPPVEPRDGVAGMLRLVFSATPALAGNLYGWEKGAQIAW